MFLTSEVKCGGAAANVTRTSLVANSASINKEARIKMKMNLLAISQIKKTIGVRVVKSRDTRLRIALETLT